MDVDRVSFFPLLLDILDDLEQSLFVAIDLELSGVPTKQDRVKGRTGRPSIQERYDEVKQAAEKYHILQFGLTCVVPDTAKGEYVCKPYNIELSPDISDTGLGIERDFSFSSSAVQFLHSVQFDFNKPFSVGVQYLSEREITNAQADYDARQKRTGLPDMEIKDTDVEALALFMSTRKTIDAWLKKPAHTSDYWLNIGPEGFDKEFDGDTDEIVPEFNRFQKRLIHQLVRAEYPQLTSYGKRGFIQIQRMDEQREARFQAERKADFDKRLMKQKGFSWVMNAVLGKISAPFDFSLCAYHPVTGTAIMVDMDVIKNRFERVTKKLREQPRVIVGHNCFLDLVYIYHIFIGPLPDQVEEFQAAVHQEWPLIIDTKYLATHNCGDINPSSSLEEIAYELRHQPGDDVVDIIDPEHNKYDDVDHFHEAGFDSLLTAQVAIRLSRKLQKTGAYLDDLENDLGGVSLSSDKPTSKLSAVVSKTKGVVGASLSTLGFKNGVNTDGAGDEQGMRGISGGIPSFDSDFWKVYGNNLRVFGTQEGLLSLR